MKASRFTDMVLVAGGLLLSSACAMFQSSSPPDWIGGAAQEYPADRYLLGVGEADVRSVAEERSYAAVAKIFKAEIHAQSQDWESYRLVEGTSQNTSERQVTLEQMTHVSTDKVLENVRVLDRWFNQEDDLYVVLAGIDRKQAAQAMEERIHELDEMIEVEVREARQIRDKLPRLRKLRRAAQTSVVREAANADLRIIRPNGAGMPAPYNVAALMDELHQYLAENLIVGVDVVGDEAEPIRRAVMEGLSQEGFPVTVWRDMSEPRLSDMTTDGVPELVVTGRTRFWDIDVPDPLFQYVRWCSDFQIVDRVTQRVVGIVSRSGREGHVTQKEALARASRTMQQVLNSELTGTLAAYVYGESEASPTASPAACPH